MKRLVLILIVVFSSCSWERPTEFSPESLQETFLDWNESSITFQEIVNKYKGKKILIDVWASWCKDCIVTLPQLQKLQSEHTEVVFVFLSLDRTMTSWKKGVQRFQIRGEHYFMKEGKKGALGDFLNLWWIPRYVVVDEVGKISLFKATKITDKKIREALKN